MTRTVDLEDRLPTNYRAMNPVLSRRPVYAPGPRTAILVRCTVSEAEEIREAARRRELPINAFVLQGLKRVWSVQTNPSIRPTEAATEVPAKALVVAANS